MSLCLGLLPVTALAADSITIAGDIVAANGIPIVIRGNNGITSIYHRDTNELLSGETDVSDKLIYGGWNDNAIHDGDTYVTLESGTVIQKIFGGGFFGSVKTAHLEV